MMISIHVQVYRIDPFDNKLCTYWEFSDMYKSKYNPLTYDTTYILPDCCWWSKCRLLEMAPQGSGCKSTNIWTLGSVSGALLNARVKLTLTVWLPTGATPWLLSALSVQMQEGPKRRSLTTNSFDQQIAVQIVNDEMENAMLLLGSNGASRRGDSDIHSWFPADSHWAPVLQQLLWCLQRISLLLSFFS